MSASRRQGKRANNNITLIKVYNPLHCAEWTMEYTLWIKQDSQGSLHFNIGVLPEEGLLKVNYSSDGDVV